MVTQAIKDRFKRWWNNEKSDRPMIRCLAAKDYDQANLIDLSTYKTAEDIHANPRYRVDALANTVCTCDMLYESIPNTDINYGPGAMAAYLGLSPQFQTDTVWYREYKTSRLNDIPLPEFNKDAPYFRKHLQETRDAVKYSDGRFPVCIPDILENLDVLALLRGNEDLCFDLMDDPCGVHTYLDAISNAYMDYYDAFYDVVRFGKEDRECMYMGFHIWGPDKTVKIQCDFSGIISPLQFKEFVIPHLKRQTEEIPYSLYHLDGKDAVRHLGEILKLENLNALQWTPGAGQPDCGDEQWYPIYDRVMDAGKSLWLYFSDGSSEDMIARSKKIADRYHNKGLYFHYFPLFSQKDACLLQNTFGTE